MKRVAITGANGYLASLIRLYNEDRFEFVRVSRRDVDYSKPGEVAAFFSDLDFDVLFHTAADAATSDCENDPEGTHRINCDSAIEIAKVCRERNKRMLFISTEQVFNGKAVPGPFGEGEEAASVTNYGLQKAEVDAWMRRNMDDYVILRLSWMFGMALPHVKPSPGIVGNVLKAMRTKTPTRFTVNEKRCMTYAQRLADQFGDISALPSGTYHFASKNDKCTYECAKIVASKLGYRDGEIDHLILPDMKRYSDRFRDFRLDNSKALSAGIELGTFEEDADRCLEDFGWA
jgi:dTDP-4-dehydrorhamnose reductase